ncbi:MAG: hypothetical protein OXN17_01355 [Candidatus Poribacteria bacterium]|nr:hypothetical protein [Candidatus Poribacteria bacterium]MDE0504419.1 hypothetical protein [Candidatus Poribacteria bacterium]
MGISLGQERRRRRRVKIEAKLNREFKARLREQRAFVKEFTKCARHLRTH